jgi:PhnB protein
VTQFGRSPKVAQIQSPSSIRAAIPYLIVADAAAAIEFYAMALGAVEVTRLVGADGRVGHAELRIGAATVYLADEHPELEDILGPASRGGTSVMVDLEVTDVDAVFERAVAAGATAVRLPDHPESGVQSAKVVDPFGHVWLITRVLPPTVGRD